MPIKSIIIQLSLLICTPFYLLSQTPIKFEEVNKVPNVSRQELYQRARDFFIKEFKDMQESIQKQDSGSGELVAKGQIFYEHDCHTRGVISYTLYVFIKDGRYKYILSEFIHIPNPKNVECTIFDFSNLYEDVEIPDCIHCQKKSHYCKKEYANMKSEISLFSKNITNKLKNDIKGVVNSKDW